MSNRANRDADRDTRANRDADKDTRANRDADDALSTMPAEGVEKFPHFGGGKYALFIAFLIGIWVSMFPKYMIKYDISKCTFAGITAECMPGIMKGDGYHFLTAHYFVFVNLCAIGLYNLTYVTKWDTTNWFRISTSFYAIITGFFALFRAEYGVSRPLLIGAAIHNLFEWSFLINVTQGNKEKKMRYMSYAAALIAIVIFLVVLLPDLTMGIVAEQTSGIMLDFALPFIYAKGAMHPDPEVRKFFVPAFAAVIIHLFLTILPLVWANYAVTDVTTFTYFNELCVYLSSAITHFTYINVGRQADKLFNEDLDEKGDHKNQHYMIPKPRFYLIVGFILGTVAIVLVTFSLPQVNYGVGVITGTTIGVVHPGFTNAFIDHINAFGLREKAHKFPGNVGYEVYHNVYNPEEVRFIESWANQEALQKWLKGPPADLFSQDITKKLLVGEKLTVQGGYTLDTNKEKGKYGGVHFAVGSDCDKVWKVVGNWSDCSWVIGCEHADVRPNNYRVLYFPRGQKVTVALLDKDDHLQTLTYQMTDKKYTGTLVLHDTSPDDAEGKAGKQCSISYNFQVDGKQYTTDGVYKDFYTNRVPALEKMFKN